MGREYLSHFPCGHPGCTEHGHYSSSTRADQADLQRRYGNKQWRCVRHTRPDEVLSMQRRVIRTEMASGSEPHGIYWGHSGFVSGPGFKAFAKDFPPGTIIAVTAEIIPPHSEPGQEPLDEIAAERRAQAALLKAARRITKGLDIDELTTKAREWHGSGRLRWFSHASLRDLWAAVERLDRLSRATPEEPTP